MCNQYDFESLEKFIANPAELKWDCPAARNSTPSNPRLIAPMGSDKQIRRTYTNVEDEIAARGQKQSLGRTSHSPGALGRGLG